MYVILKEPFIFVIFHQNAIACSVPERFSSSADFTEHCYSLTPPFQALASILAFNAACHYV